MADREVEVSVNAEGVDEAAGEMGGDAATGGVGGPSGSGGGGRLGGKLIARLVGLLAVLGPILDVLGVVSQVLEAFVAPLAVVLLRILQPALRLLIRVLPVWFDIFDAVLGAIDFLEQLRGAIVAAVMRLPSMIGAAVANKLPEFPSLDGDGVIQRGVDFVTGDDGGGGGGGRDGPLVSIGGGLLPFIDRLTQNGSVDFP